MVKLEDAAQELEGLNDEGPVLPLITLIPRQAEHLASLLVVSKVEQQAAKELKGIEGKFMVNERLGY